MDIPENDEALDRRDPLGPRLLGLAAGIIITASFLFLLLNVGKPTVSSAIEPATAMPSLTDRDHVGQPLPAAWPGGQTVHWGRKYRDHNGDSRGLWILDATENDHRKVFRVRPVDSNVAGSPNRLEPAATVFMEPQGEINIYLPPGTYEIYAASGENWNHGIAQDSVVVSYGYVEVSLDNKALIIVGATDQDVIKIPRSWF